MDILLFKDYYMFRIGFNYFENSNQSVGKMNEILIVIRRYCLYQRVFMVGILFENPLTLFKDDYGLVA
jgi:hypothetical protein